MAESPRYGRLLRDRNEDLAGKAAVNIAINRGHDQVLPDDLLSAREQYSQYAFNSILKEDDPVKGKLEAVLYEFAGTGKQLLKKMLNRYSSRPESNFMTRIFTSIYCVT